MPTNSNATVPPEIHAAIDRAINLVIELMMAYITNAVEPTRADDPNNIVGAVKAIEGALRRIEAAIAQPPSAFRLASQAWQPIEMAPKDTRVLIGFTLKLPEKWIRVGLGTNLLGEWMWSADVLWDPATHYMPFYPPAYPGEMRATEPEQ